MNVASENRCERCERAVVCHVCETCEEHCAMDGDPEACWEAHERWRSGGKDPSLEATAERPLRRHVRAVPRPTWPS